jgi:hypothetical protein
LAESPCKARPSDADGLDLALVRGIDALETRSDAVRIAGRRLGNLEAGEASRIMRRELGRRAAHDIEIEVVHPRLIEHDVREFRQAVLDVLHAAAAHDVRRLFIVGLPEGGLVDPAGLF